MGACSTSRNLLLCLLGLCRTCNIAAVHSRRHPRHLAAPLRCLPPPDPAADPTSSMSDPATAHDNLGTLIQGVIATTEDNRWRETPPPPHHTPPCHWSCHRPPLSFSTPIWAPPSWNLISRHPSLLRHGSRVCMTIHALECLEGNGLRRRRWIGVGTLLPLHGLLVRAPTMAGSREDASGGSRIIIHVTLSWANAEAL
jgi:hypothetical protein